MRDDAARALRVDDELPRHEVELRSVSSIDDAYADLRARASERAFERTPRTASAAAVALQERAAEPRSEPVRVPRTAPGRSYGAHRREDPYTPSRRVAG